VSRGQLREFTRFAVPKYDTSGERNKRAKVTWETVTAVRKLLAEGVPRTEIARQLGLKYELVHRIDRGKSWPECMRPRTRQQLGAGLHAAP
jgi:hypothetical protein